MKRFIPIALMVGLLFTACEKEQQIQTNSEIENSDYRTQLKTDYSDYLQLLIDQVNEFVASELLNKGNANALISKINAAIISLDKGNLNASNGQLNAFVNQVEDFVDNGILPSDIGQQLIEDAQQAIDGDYSLWQCGDPLPDERDGNAYETVQIGNQCWMAENLAYLPSVNLSSAGSRTTPYYYVYGYEGSDISAAKMTDNYQTYGVLYNWSAAMDKDNVCPDGWHLASDEEWMTLEMKLGMTQADAEDTFFRLSGDVDKKIKSTTGWPPYHINITNESGFTALPGGTRGAWGEFQDVTEVAFFWTSTEKDYRKWMRLMTGRDGVRRDAWFGEMGMSVRCLKDTE